MLMTSFELALKGGTTKKSKRGQELNRRRGQKNEAGKRMGSNQLVPTIKPDEKRF